MNPALRPPRWTPLLAVCAVVLAATSVVSGCASTSTPEAGSSSSLPTRDQAFQHGEVQINQVLIALHQRPTSQFSYSEGLCNESDDAHGHVSVNYTIPGKYGSSQAEATLKSAGSAMKSLGFGTPVYETQPDGVYVDNSSSGLLFESDGGTLSFAFQSCYSTPAPSNWWKSDGLQPLTVSPAPTSTAGTPEGVPSAAAAGSGPTSSGAPN